MRLYATRRRRLLLIISACLGMYMFYTMGSDVTAKVTHARVVYTQDVLELDNPGWKSQRLGGEAGERGMGGERETPRGVDKDGTDGVLRFSSYEHALQSRSDPNNFIILSMLDMGALSMGLNFWETSLVPYNISTYLFISSSPEACEALHGKGIPCYLYVQDSAAGDTSLYHSKDFLRKMNIRTYMILDALHLGYTVLHTDVDVIWMKNPFDYFGCAKCDFAILWDCGAFNAGFLYIRPTEVSIAVYQRMKQIASKTSLDDQKALNLAIRENRRQMTLMKLNQNRFVCGKSYFEKGKRYFADQAKCEQCVVIHNNWIVSMEAKIYRFKELNLWMYDDDGYYSNPDRKYVTYGNVARLAGPIKRTKDLEKKTLQHALAIAFILNRTLIIPPFHSGKKNMTNLLDYIKIRDFDAAYGTGYRESTFLRHPKVPDAVKASRTEGFFIASARGMEITTPGAGVTRLTPANKAGASPREIRQWFGDREESVLVFHSLYAAFNKFTTPAEGKKHRAQIAKGFRPGKYRQF